MQDGRSLAAESAAAAAAAATAAIDWALSRSVGIATTDE